jgi:hypothetical protein
VISWLGVWYVKAELYERAIEFFERASEIQPGEVKWKLMVASCHRRMANYAKALECYEAIHGQHPDDPECERRVGRGRRSCKPPHPSPLTPPPPPWAGLKYLVILCKDAGRRFDHYEARLARVERAKAAATVAAATMAAASMGRAHGGGYGGGGDEGGGMGYGGAGEEGEDMYGGYAGGAGTSPGGGYGGAGGYGYGGGGGSAHMGGGASGGGGMGDGMGGSDDGEDSGGGYGSAYGAPPVRALDVASRAPAPVRAAAAAPAPDRGFGSSADRFAAPTVGGAVGSPDREGSGRGRDDDFADADVSGLLVE